MKGDVENKACTRQKALHSICGKHSARDLIYIWQPPSGHIKDTGSIYAEKTAIKAVLSAYNTTYHSSSKSNSS